MENIMKNDFTATKILEFLSNNDIIDIEDVESAMRSKEIESVVEQNHKYSIYKGTDGRWKTYIEDPSKPNGRRLIAKKSKDDLLKLLYDEYTNGYFKARKENITLNELYKEWLSYKALHTNASTYIVRIESAWKKYYSSDKIIETPISSLNKIILDKWAHALIKNNNLTKKAYYNITLIIRQCLDYAVDIELIDTNPFTKFKIDNRLFAVEEKKSNETQVFSIKETRLIKECAWNHFYDGTHRNQPLIPLTILFQLQTGLRLGELRALAFNDIFDRYVAVSKFISGEPGELINHTKGSYGSRKVFLTEEAKLIVQTAANKKEELRKLNTPFLFSITDRPLSSSSINHAYYKYCDEIGIFRKSSHKVRKTVISSLIDSGMNINTIREIAGHKDEKTTYRSYCYDRNPDDRNIDLMNKALL